MKHSLITTTGKKTSTIDLPGEIFAAKVNHTLLSRYVKVYLSRQRSAGAKTKTRGQVTGSTRKIYRQKGTGRARHGARKAPIFVGGGVTHGPTGQENFTLSLPKSQRKQALFSAATAKLADSLFLDTKTKLGAKTQELAKIIVKLSGGQGKTLLVLPQPEASLIQAGANIKNLTLTQAARLNPYELLNHQTIIYIKESVAKLTQVHLAKPASSPTATKPAAKTTTKKSTKK